MIAAIPFAYKVVGIVAAIGLVILAGNLWLSSVKSTAYQSGVTACQQTAARALQEANEENRKREADLEGQIAGYADRFNVVNGQRREREEVIVTRFDDRLARTENCEVSPEVIELRNQIRQQQ